MAAPKMCQFGMRISRRFCKLQQDAALIARDFLMSWAPAADQELQFCVILVTPSFCFICKLIW